MYAEHVPLIAAHMRGSLDGFRRGVLFAVLSIRQPITGVPEDLDAVQRKNYDPLFGHKFEAFEYLEKHGAALLADMLALETNAARMERLLDMPGLGIVKAGFILQLMGWDVACLDTRNVKREGRNPRAFETRGHKGGRKRGPAFKRLIARYLAEVEGKAAYYWDTWCEHVATVYGMTAHEISALHLAVTVVPQFDLAETF